MDGSGQCKNKKAISTRKEVQSARTEASRGPQLRLELLEGGS